MRVSGLASATSARSGTKLCLRLAARQSLSTGGIHMALDPHMECQLHFAFANHAPVPVIDGRHPSIE